MHRNDVSVAQGGFEVPARTLHVGVVHAYGHAEASQAPIEGPANGAIPDDGGPPAGHLPSAKTLIRDGPVPEHLRLTDIPVSGQDVAGQRDKQADCELGDCICVSSGCADHRYAGGCGSPHVDVVWVTACCCHRHKWQLEYGGVNEVRFHDRDVSILGHKALGQTGAVVDP